MTAGSYYYKVAVNVGGQESELSDYTSVTVSGSSSGGGGDTLAGAKGKLPLTGFNEFDGKYVFAALLTVSEKSAVGMTAVELISHEEAIISMVPISGGNAEVPLYNIR